MKLLAVAHRFFEQKRTVCLVFWLVSVLLGCALGYLAGAYCESGGAIALKIVLCVLSFIMCGFSFLVQVLVWTANPRLRFGKLEVNIFVQLLTIDMVALLLCFAIYGPIGFNNPKSFIAVSQLAPSAMIFVFLLVSALLLVAIRAKAYARRDGNAMMTKVIHEPLLPWFLVIYFLLLIAPYSFAPVASVNAFLTGSGKIPYRLFTTALLGIYSLYLWIKHRLRPRFDLLIPMALLWGSFALACAFAPRVFTYVSESFNGSFAFLQTVYDEASVWIQLPLLICDCFVFFCFVSFFPPCVSKKTQVVIPLMAIVFYVVAACLFSYVKEFGSYVNYINGSDQSKGAIQSWTQSKNAFGILLFQGAFVSTFLLYYVKRWWRFVFAILDIAFFITSYIVQCYTAMVPILFVCLLLFIYAIVVAHRRKRIFGFAIMGCGLVLAVAIILCVFVPNIYETNSLLNKIHAKVFYFFDHEILSRTKKWNLALIICRGPYAFIGKSSMAELELLLRESSVLDMAYPDFHSGYVAMYGAAGLAGLSMYVFTIGLAMKNIWTLSKNRMLLLVLTGLFFACLLFSMPETYTLFLSMSAVTLPFTYVFIVFGPFFRRTRP